MSVLDNGAGREQIFSDIVKLRQAIGGLVAEKRNGVSFPVKSAKDLMLKLRNAADDLGMPLAGAPIETTVVQIPDFKLYNKDALTCHVVVKVRFMSSDGSYLDGVGSGHGSSNDDKAGGKASTYAWKDAVVKILSLPDDEMVDTDDVSIPVSINEKKTFSFKK